ncbi:MAG: M56 family metallopeptidase [Rhodothermaceae bacterium]|nr:M56 family metallopeptidase [Rhodothermaceae bacterium]
MDWTSYLNSIGGFSIEYLWIPLGIWTIAALPLFFISKFLGRRQPVIHYHACLALLFSLPLGFLIMPLTSAEVPGTNLPQGITAYVDGITDFATTTQINQQPQSKLTYPEESRTTIAKPIDYTRLIGAISLLILALIAIYLIRLCFKLYRLRPHFSVLKSATDSEALSTLNRLSRSMGIKRSVQLRIAPAGSIPCTYGWKKPVIVVPEHILSEKDALNATLLHELIHVQRNDFLLGLTAHVLSSLFLLHPLVLLIRRDLGIYRELSCDHEVIRHKIVPTADYARLLLRFSNSSQSPSFISMVKSKSALKRRVAGMQTYSIRRPVIKRMFIPAFLLIPALLLSCSSDSSNPTTDSNVIALKDIGFSFKLPDEWIVGNEYRSTRKNAYQDYLDSTPPDIHHMYDKKKIWMARLLPEKTLYGRNNYHFTNMTQDNFQELIEGKLKFYTYGLSITYNTRKSRKARNLWKEGKCMNYRKGIPELCDKPKDHQPNYRNYRLVRQLDKTEIPFNADSGFLYESEFPYRQDVNEEFKHSRFLIYSFYAVKGDKSYQIKLTGTANRPEQAYYTENGILIEEEAVSEMLSSIRFH